VQGYEEYVRYYYELFDQATLAAEVLACGGSVIPDEQALGELGALLCTVEDLQFSFPVVLARGRLDQSKEPPLFMLVTLRTPASKESFKVFFSNVNSPLAPAAPLAPRFHYEQSMKCVKQLQQFQKLSVNRRGELSQVLFQKLEQREYKQRSVSW